ncbi:hypothetical protein TraAM80_05468 [Trypanosoma rangeli]|uniref:BTB domain-containing protein n=1 Tax=Trypanosoma rangeli TaxID=5698 RepID=A0A3R7K9T3_TRYRA|nr:uncharacterized protein TraAM80_05468 [Trypanosoma rangeli]RNF04018.1 hypothetical protein TraAM80_05468 [Trypanosoma rangeli]|eukprot:RNF04018.1 hypothetical protein TraAM80_05468 [Trypanosoma rangeli]
MHVDSDEEAAAACTAGEWRALQTPTTAHLSNTALGNIATKLRDLRQELVSFDERVPEVVTFRVDGKLFSVHRELLRNDPQSVLFLMTESRFRRDGDGRHVSDVIEVPGRDATLFGMLMNLLRGYRNPIPEAYREACAAEAHFYGLDHSWESRYPVAAVGPFRPLTCSDRLFSDVVCAAASPFYSSGLHCITFGMTRCETLAVGVVAEGAPLRWIDSIGRCEGLALYWNDGRVAHNFGGLCTEKTSCAFTANAVVKVNLDCEENIVRWSLGGEQSVAVVRLPPEASFAFAAVLVRSSEVQILHSA